jgi:O-acetyl-ADP-ribose deacetylase (regulator of RNase III)
MKYEKGDLLAVETGVIAHGCNARGVMNSGVALQIKENFRQAFTDYKNYEISEGLSPGDLVQPLTKINDSLYIANCITQIEYGYDNRRYVSYDALYESVKKAALKARRLKLSLHLPKIGSDRGGGSWRIIEAILLQIEEEVGVPITIWEYNK